jgi:hypothetical protein
MRKTIPAIAVLLTFLFGHVASAQEQASPISSGPLPELSSLTGSGVWQLRIYTINRGRLDDFADAWLEGVYPLRLRHGFKIPAAWLIRETNQFVWVLGYDGPEDWDAAQAAYYGSTERTSLEVDPLQFIARGESFSITPVPGSAGGPD